MTLKNIVERNSEVFNVKVSAQILMFKTDDEEQDAEKCG